MRRWLLLLALIAASPVVAGPVSKYNDDAPDVDIVSPVPLHDIERCLIDLDGHPAPQIYWQADRPGEVRMMWLVQNKAHGRADLKSTAEGTHVVIWSASNQMRSCARTGRRN